MDKKMPLLLILAFTFMAVALVPNNASAATGNGSQSVGASVQGSMLSPGYVFVPGTAIVSPQPVALQLTSNGQPAYVDSVLYSGTNPSNQSLYLQPNYNNPTGVADQPLSSSLFPSSTANPMTTAGFIRVGNVLPTSAERQSFLNYTSYPRYQSSYPWKDILYSNQNATAPANVMINLTRYNTTMNLDQWSTFNINQNQSMVITTTLSLGLFNAYFAQLYGQVHYAIFNVNGTGIHSNSLPGGRNGFIDTFYINPTNIGNKLIYIALWSNADSQIIVRVSKVTFNPSTLNLNSPVQGSQNFKFSDITFYGDPFQMFDATHFKTFKFTVPSSLNNKFFTIQLQTIFGFSPNLQIFSDQGRTGLNNTAILGRTGETWTIIFNVYDNTNWYYYLVVQPTTVPNYTFGTEQDYIFPQNTISTYYLQLNVSSSSLYRIYMESKLMNSPYSTVTTNVKFYNGNQTLYLSLSSFSLNNLYYFKNGTYLVAISSTSTSNRVNIIFEMDSITPGINTVQGSLGLRDFLVAEFDNPYIGNTYNVSLRFLTDKSSATYSLNVFNAFGISEATHAPSLSNPGTNFTSYNITSPFWGSKLYAFIYPTAISDSNTTRDLTSLALNMTIKEYKGQYPAPTVTPSINVTPTTAGFYSYFANATTNIILQVNLTNLPTRTWIRVDIKSYNNNMQTGTSQFGFIQLPTISITTGFAITSMSEYFVQTITGGIITGFGFGSMNTTATMNLHIHRINANAGNLTVSLLPQLTQSLNIGYPLPGPIAPSASSAPAIADVGAAPGFLLIPALGLLGVLVIVRKIRHNKKD